MLPAVHPGDIVWVRSADATRARPGDIVLFAREERLVVHRVTERWTKRGELRWVTRGDTLSYKDPPISSAELLGRIVAIERGKRLIIPRRSLWARLGSLVLARSEFCTAMVLRFQSQS
jgi:signal peptidase I